MNIAVIYGGKSVEHDISIITGKQVACALSKHNVVEIYIDRRGVWRLAEDIQPRDFVEQRTNRWKEVHFRPASDSLYRKNRKVFRCDAAVLALHGVNGEDGSVSGVLQLADIPCVPSGICACAVAMDKAVFKVFLEGLKLPILPYIVTNSGSSYNEVCNLVQESVPFPLILKPSRCGSSIGIEKVEDIDELSEALKRARQFDDCTVIEHALTDFFEVNCAVYADDGKFVVSDLEKPIRSSDILSFADKYVSGGKFKKRDFPFHFDKEEEVKQTAELLYARLNADGVMRVDFMVDNVSGIPYVLEVNSIPGSLAYYLFGANVGKHVENLIEEAIAHHLREKAITRTFSSNVLAMRGKK
ncbi:MAG: hypothetical protein PHX51_05170 [Clostridia bacterium]|nr:hypothetical protein [Clostridia bacterium]